MKRLIAIGAVLILFLLVFSFNFNPKPPEKSIIEEKVKVLSEESVVIDTVKKVGPSVITIIKDLPARPKQPVGFGPFYIFGFDTAPQDPEPQSIGSGFVVSKDGLIVTNKHVVLDTSAEYQVLTSTDQRYDVERIYRDPLNDVAILKVNASGLEPLELGDSSNLEVGQFVIAIGTALGQFRNTVTTGVISGLGRGITAENAFEGFAEKLDNVIQTDAAINPGNSGGPLLNSSSQVIGVNTAVASAGQNIGFALPVNAIKTTLDTFNKGGQFDRPYLGVSYRVLDKEIALLNDLPAGAYVDNVILGSPAQKAGVIKGDIIIEVNGRKIEKDKFELSAGVSQNKIGDTINLKVWRGGKIIELKATLGKSPEQ